MKTANKVFSTGLTIFAIGITVYDVVEYLIARKQRKAAQKRNFEIQKAIAEHNKLVIEIAKKNNIDMDQLRWYVI